MRRWKLLNLDLLNLLEFLVRRRKEKERRGKEERRRKEKERRRDRDGDGAEGADDDGRENRHDGISSASTAYAIVGRQLNSVRGAAIARPMASEVAPRRVEHFLTTTTSKKHTALKSPISRLIHASLSPTPSQSPPPAADQTSPAGSAASKATRR